MTMTTPPPPPPLHERQAVASPSVSEDGRASCVYVDVATLCFIWRQSMIIMDTA